MEIFRSLIGGLVSPLVFLIGLMQILTGAPSGWLVTIVGAVMWLQFVASFGGRLVRRTGKQDLRGSGKRRRNVDASLSGQMHQVR
jgi:hypothetical protein